MRKLKLGIPKGSLESSTVELFRRAGWEMTYSSRSYFPTVNDEDLACSLVRAQEMSRYIEDGTLDLGITGKDWISENASDVAVLQDLIYSKASTQEARWVLVVREDSPVEKLADLQGKKISTELVSFTRRYFASHGIDVKVEFSWGATEAKVVEGLVDAIVEVTETGATLRANKLRIVHELMRTNPQLIANREALRDTWKREKCEQIRTLLRSSLLAMNKVCIKLNVEEKNLQEVLALLPSLNSPTVSVLSASDWRAVETVVSVAAVRDLIPRLLACGAQGIVEYSLNKVI